MKNGALWVFVGCSLFWCVFVILMVLWLGGCATRIEYQPIPAWLIPLKPTVPTIPSDQLSCLADDAYTKLAERDRTCWQYASELRALLDAK